VAVAPAFRKTVVMTDAATTDRLYFRQLLAGRDIATNDPLARQMVNFVYLIGDRETGEAVAIDPAYDVQGIVDVLAADDMKLTGVLATHYHPDHVGGEMMGYSIEGVHELLDIVSVPIHVQTEEAEYVSKVTNLTAGDLVTHSSGDVVMVGDISAIAATKVFEEVYLMTQGGPADATKTLVYYVYDQAFAELEISYACTVGLALFVIVLLLSLVRFAFAGDQGFS